MNSSKCHWALGMLAVLAVGACLEASELRPVKFGKHFPKLAFEPVQGFAAARKTMGLTWSKAIVAKSGRSYIALDADKADAQFPSTLKIVTGFVPAFAKGVTIPLKFVKMDVKTLDRKGATTTIQVDTAMIAPMAVSVRVGTKTVEQMIAGTVQVYKGRPVVNLIIASRMAAVATVAGKNYALLAYDTNGDMKISDKELVELYDRKTRTPVPLNSLFKLGETWVTLKYDAASSSVTTVEFKGKEGTIVSSADIAHLSLMSKEAGRFEISGKAGTKIPAPAMAYNIGQFNLILNPKSGAGYQGAVPDKLSLSVAEGKETTLPLPKTLISTFAISQGSGTVRFSVALADDAGSRNVTLTKFGKKTPPEIEVLDKAGKVVHTGRLEYG